MRAVRDSFLHFCSDNLSGLTLHALRTDPDSPSSAVFAMNAVNIHFANLDLGVDVTTQHAVIDVVYDSENAAVDAITQVWQLLNASFTCPLLDYTDPSSPTPVGTNNITWDRHGVKFRSVRADFYCHFTCSLKLVFHTN